MDLRETGDQPRHPWEMARRDFFLAVLGRHKLLGQSLRVLDGGAGDAWFASNLLAHLGSEATVTCWDAEYSDAVEAQLRESLPARIALVRQRPQRAHELVTLLDVLEHVPDDRAFLAAVAQESLSPGGFVLISVPAWQGLYTQHDTFLHHHRRYAPEQMRAVIAAAGLKIVQEGGLFHSLLLPRAAEKLRERLTSRRDQPKPGIAWSHGKWVTGTVLGALKLDNAVSHAAARLGLGLPGLSYWALCRKDA